MNPWVKRVLIAVPILVILFFGAIFVYAEFLNDPAEELGTADLSEAVAGSDTTEVTTVTTATTVGEATSATATPATTDAPATTAAPTAATAGEPGGAAGGVDGSWTVTSDSEFGYRVEEVLFGVNTTATGRSNQISGTMTIDGTTVSAAEFTVDVATIESDENRRDSQFRGRIMEVDQFPDATFTLTEPIDFEAVPASGEQITASATGDLTLHGVTRPVTFDVTAEAGDSRLGVLGTIPVTFADYEIDNPSTSGITTEDNGLLEFVLVFVPA